MGNKVEPVDRRIARRAAKQHGIITHRQLRELGLGRAAISKRAAAGRLHRLHQGVYAVGNPAPGREGRWMAAVLACGSGALLSHRSAASLLGLLTPREGPIHISVATHSGRAQRIGIRLHGCRSLRPQMATRRLGIPVTTPARTIADLRAVSPAWEVRRAIRQAEIMGLPLGDRMASDGTRSDLERGFLGLCRGHGLPAPEVNVRIGRYLVDFLWRDRRLVVEADSYRYHRGHVAFQDDHRRDLDLRALGYETIRLSEKQLNEEPRHVADVLRAELRRLATPRSDL